MGADNELRLAMAPAATQGAPESRFPRSVVLRERINARVMRHANNASQISSFFRDSAIVRSADCGASQSGAVDCGAAAATQQICSRDA